MRVERRLVLPEAGGAEVMGAEVEEEEVGNEEEEEECEL